MYVLKINLPYSAESYEQGKGECAIVTVSNKVIKYVKKNKEHMVFSGTLVSDSKFFPTLVAGNIIKFELRGDKAAVGLWFEQLIHLPHIDEEQIEIINAEEQSKIIEFLESHNMIEQIDMIGERSPKAELIAPPDTKEELLKLLHTNRRY